MRNQLVFLLVAVALAGCGSALVPQDSRGGSSPQTESPGPNPAAPAPIAPAGAMIPDGAGSSGGGHGLTEKGKLVLRELVEGTVCEWVDGPHFFGTYISPKSEARDWETVMLDKQPLGFLFYFLLNDRMLLKAYYEETIQLNVCLSQKPLRTLPENLDQSIASYQTRDIDKKTEAPTQIAIRIGNDIFIDRAAYEGLDAINKEYTQFHEVMHAFIPMSTPARMTRLRDFVAGVRALDLKIPRRENGNYAYALTPEFAALTKGLAAEYELLKKNSHVTFVGEAASALALVDKYVLLGDVQSLKVVFEKNGLVPSQRGASGLPLFYELVFTLRECESGDERPFCQSAPLLLNYYLEKGANPDFSFTTGEWDPMPAWEYLLFSTNRPGREPRMDYAEILFKAIVARAKGMTPALQARLDDVLVRLCRDNFLAAPVARVLKWGANVNAKNEQGSTALLVAVEKKGNGNNLFHGYPATHLVGVLMNGGADLTAKNADGKTALEVMKDFKGPLRDIYDNGKRYELGIKALEAGSIDKLREEFKTLGMPLD